MPDVLVTVKYSHPEDFPIGGPETCAPDVNAPEPGDGLPHLMGRLHWGGRFPKHVRDATGFDHPSIDWNECGHPDKGFSTPHYDVHFHTVPPTFRATSMVCPFACCLSY
jgi:hypothetical protein